MIQPKVIKKKSDEIIFRKSRWEEINLGIKLVKDKSKKKKKASLDNTGKNPAALGNVSGVQLCSLAEDSSQEDVLGMVLTARHNARDINGST